MCGICGYIGKENRTLLQQMGNTILHRGPDEEGLWSKEQVNLCSRRLTIIDPEGGVQPYLNKSGEISLVWNGEIYNTRELRQELEQKGIAFQTKKSDTELLLHLYENEGLDFLQKVNGMFAISIYDQKKKKLFLIRDRMGVKPLFYYWDGMHFIFGSEQKAIFQHPDCKKKIRTESLYQYFSYHTVCSPDTLYENLFEVPPAGILTVDLYEGKAIQLSKETYWCLSFEPKEDNTCLEKDCIERIRELLCDAVKIRMQANVEIGAFLSGGLDSSLVTALMIEADTQSNKLRTYSLGYGDVSSPGKREDVQFASQLAKQWDTCHSTVTISANDMIEQLPQIQKTFDQPFSANPATYFLTKQMGAELKCALSGDGADELFGSYYGARLAAEGKIPFGTEVTAYENLLTCSDELKGFLLSEEIFGSLIKEQATRQKISDQVSRLKARDPVNRFLEYQWNSALVDQVLTYTDRLSMVHSLEVRAPFLDYRLVEYVASLPGISAQTANMAMQNTIPFQISKMPDGEPKYLLKKAAEGYLPNELIYRKKEMFFPPVHEWMTAGMKKEILEKLSESRLRKNPYLNEKNIQYLLHRFYQNPMENAAMGDIIWNLYCFQVWMETD